MKRRGRSRALMGVLASAALTGGCDRGTERLPASEGDAAPGAMRGSEDPVSPEGPWFTESASSLGVHFTHASGARGAWRFPEIMGGGGAALDADGDGWMDLYLVQAGHAPGSPADAETAPNRLFRNDGGHAFVDVTAGSGADDRGYGMGAATGDMDGDGRTDLYITNVGANVLLRNLGGFRFQDITAHAGTGDVGWGAGCAFVDCDRDGLLDLFVVNYVRWSPDAELTCLSPTGQRDYCSPNSYSAPAPDVLYRNTGDGRFVDVSHAAGLRTAFGNGLGVVCADFDGDGWTDIFVANDQTDNQLWHNGGDGTFRDIAMRAGVAVDRHGEPKAGMGTHVADLDGDGRPDLLVVNLRAQSDSFHRNRGGWFDDDTAAFGLGSITRPYTRFGVAFHDFDNDGHLDLFVANGRVLTAPDLPAWSSDPYAEPDVLLRGGSPAQGRRFREVRPRGGTEPALMATSRGAIFADFDNDGGMDVVVVNRDAPAHIRLNRAPQRGHWIMFRVLDTAGADALHATLRIEAGGRTIVRDVRTAYSYLAANDPRVHVGLGMLRHVDAVEVTWPDGHRRRLGPFDAGQVVVLERTVPPDGAP